MIGGVHVQIFDLQHLMMVLEEIQRTQSVK